jgi:hypothetical protein
MPPLTYYVALPFIRTADEVLAAGQPVEAPSHAAAVSQARRLMANGSAGAIAFARTGDPALGEFKDAEILAKFGDVPEDLSEL